MLIVCDIDGTIVSPRGPRKKVCSWLRKKVADGMDVVYLTNRPYGQREETRQLIKELKVPFDGADNSLILNDTDLDAPAFKRGIIEDMIKNDAADVYAFIDDRDDTRQNVKEIKYKNSKGLPILVINPNSIQGGKNVAWTDTNSYSIVERISMTSETAIEALSNVIDFFAADTKIKVPKFIRDNAKRGLELNKNGFGGDGLVDKTIREAGDMASGKITLGKCVRMSAWFARHKVDTKVEGFKNKKSPKYPSAGLVAWLLWGGDADGSFRAKDWADSQVNKNTQD
jgi:hypothetical protein